MLRDGEITRTGNVGEFDRDGVIRAMVGELYMRKEGRVRPAGDRVLSVQNLSMGSMVRNTFYSVYAGQVTGVFRLIGSGRIETAKIIAGVLKRNFFYGGEIYLNDAPISFKLPREAVLHRVVYVTEDRKAEDFFEQMAQTIWAPHQDEPRIGQGRRGGWVTPLWRGV